MIFLLFNEYLCADFYEKLSFFTPFGDYFGDYFGDLKGNFYRAKKASAKTAFLINVEVKRNSMFIKKAILFVPV